MPTKLLGTRVADPNFICTQKIICTPPRLSAILTFFDWGSSSGLPYKSPPPYNRGVLNAIGAGLGPSFDLVAGWNVTDFDGERGIFPPHKTEHTS